MQASRALSSLAEAIPRVLMWTRPKAGVLECSKVLPAGTRTAIRSLGDRNRPGKKCSRTFIPTRDGRPRGRATRCPEARALEKTPAAQRRAGRVKVPA